MLGCALWKQYNTLAIRLFNTFLGWGSSPTITEVKESFCNGLLLQSLDNGAQNPLLVKLIIVHASGSYQKFLDIA